MPLIRGIFTEEPCEVETLTHGFEAEAEGAIPSSTVTGAPQPCRFVFLSLLHAAPAEHSR